MPRSAMNGLLLLTILLAACGEPTQLYIAHNTAIGVDAAVNADRTAGHLTVGYDRRFLALAPKAVPEEAEPGEPQPSVDAREAMAALVCSELEVDGIFLTKYNEKLATGKAARNAAEVIAANPDRKSIFDCAESQPPQPESEDEQSSDSE